jgi:hypothetical protein
MVSYNSTREKREKLTVSEARKQKGGLYMITSRKSKRLLGHRLLAAALAGAMMFSLFATVSAESSRVETLKEELRQLTELFDNHPTLSNALSSDTAVEELDCGTVTTTATVSWQNPVFDIDGNEIPAGSVYYVLTLTEFPSGEVNAIAATEEFHLDGSITTTTTTFYDDKTVMTTKKDWIVRTETQYTDGKTVSHTVLDDKEVTTTKKDDVVRTTTQYTNGHWTGQVRFANGATVSFTRGRVLAATSNKITVRDALEILRYTVGLPSVLDECETAYQAALIVSEETPTIQDALQILRHITGLPSALD